MNENEKNTSETVTETETEPKKEKKQKKANTFDVQKRKKKVPVGKIILLCIIAAVLLIVFIPPLRNAVIGLLRKIPFLGKYIPGGTQEQTGTVTYSYYTVTERDITRSLEGTGTLEAIDSYEVVATVSGDIISADFEEMDKVLEDDVLFVIDSSELEDDIEDKRKDVQEAITDIADFDEDYKKLNIYSDYTGNLREVYVEAGDKVSNGTKIAYIVDSDTMLLEIPFFAANTDHIAKGAYSTVTFSSTGEVLSGTVTEISNLTSVNENNSTIRNITIAVKNPGGITYGMKAYASVAGTDGILYDCSAQGTFKYNIEETITAESSGEIEAIYFDDGDYVTKGKLVAKISSESLDDQREQLQKAYDNQVKALEDLEERLEDYTITAPISGTVVQKNYKTLDTIGSSSMSSTTTLAIIYDMSKLTFDMSIDELDLSLIEVGQKVIITTDSLERMSFEGVITKKSIVGSSSSGTTVYPVTVEIEGNDYLLPGMNVDAKIVLSSTGNVPAIPISAVTRGNTVEITKASVDRPMGSFAEKPETESVTVEIGATDGSYVEIKSGLSVGDVVVYEVKNVQTQDFDITNMMGGMSAGGFGGGMPAGGMPAGGMPAGGMPSGGMSSGGGNRGSSSGGNRSGMPSGGSFGGR